MFETHTIAIVLAVFFLFAALVNTLVNRARRRKIENQRAAQAGGGTEEAPIHLSTPFSENQVATPPTPISTDDSPSPAILSPDSLTDPSPNKEDEYVWD